MKSRISKVTSHQDETPIVVESDVKVSDSSSEESTCEIYAEKRTYNKPGTAISYPSMDQHSQGSAYVFVQDGRNSMAVDPPHKRSSVMLETTQSLAQTHNVWRQKRKPKDKTKKSE